MHATPGKHRPSGAGKATGIPTPGRSRASSTATQQSYLQTDGEYISRAFAEAIKANDPAQHRHTNANGTSLSPQSASISGIQSGRRSVTGRPSSAASTANAQSTYFVERSRTPISERPSSRHSDALLKSTTGQFQVGDQVRMESLGFEGTLRFLGDIDGKPGLWAGVELSGGFTGKGKNNGTANGVRYFDCAEKCGVFIAAFKLSAPTVGPGAVPRPSSVASSRGERTIPFTSGRITPSASAVSGRASTSSLSNGRITPSTSGRLTPISTGRITPGAPPASRSRLTSGKFTTSHVGKTPPAKQFSYGSRASKLVSMTARQLSSRDAASDSTTRRVLESPTRAHSSPSSHSSGMISPIRITGSPLNTPKSGIASRASPAFNGGLPALNKSRSSLNTPRPRIPSAVAMPPPASPASARSTSLKDLSTTKTSTNELERVSLGNGTTESFLYDTFITTSSVRSDSASSIRSLAADNQLLVDQLQSRINALEYDNERLRVATHIPVSSTDELSQIQSVQRERDEALDKISALETALSAAKSNIGGQESRLASLETLKQEATNDLEAQILSTKADFKALEKDLDAEKSLVQELRSAVDAKERAFKQKESLVNAREETISSLQLKLAAASAEFREEQLELSGQIEQLRTAGQETIALYEERLSETDSQRYDLEHRIATLETRLQNAQKADLSHPITSTDSAAEIDNQTLQDQILHLQRKISEMEDTIQDTQAATEREEAAMRERVYRLKEKEEVTRKELYEGRQEVERVHKLEAVARARVEEVEEALRESTLALESARAEVEGLRAELANLDSLVANGAGDLFSRVAEAAQSAANDKAHYKAEIADLKEILERYRASEHANEHVSRLTEEKASLQQQLEDQHTKLEALSESLDKTSRELENLKKRSNRDVAIVTSGLNDISRRSPTSPSYKNELSIDREEITGLKHIVQELQKENLTATQRIKILESENQLLSSEASQLRQEVQILEEDLDSSLEQDEKVAGGSKGIDGSQRKLREEKSHREIEVERDQLRKRLGEVEMKSARAVHDLNKEISELEALVESKIYREDELEQEVERMREKLARYDKKKSKGGAGTPDAKKTTKTEAVCEICEKAGHDIFSCDVLNKDSLGSKELFCEDCESHGHTSADCPHSLDVF